MCQLAVGGLQVAHHFLLVLVHTLLEPVEKGAAVARVTVAGGSLCTITQIVHAVRNFRINLDLNVVIQSLWSGLV